MNKFLKVIYKNYTYIYNLSKCSHFIYSANNKELNIFHYNRSNIFNLSLENFKLIEEFYLSNDNSIDLLIIEIGVDNDN